jgi:hypothetical protein
VQTSCHAAENRQKKKKCSESTRHVTPAKRAERATQLGDDRRKRRHSNIAQRCASTMWCDDATTHADVAKRANADQLQRATPKKEISSVVARSSSSAVDWRQSKRRQSLHRR